MKFVALVACALAGVVHAQIFTSLNTTPPSVSEDGFVRTPGPRPSAGTIFHVDTQALKAQLFAAPQERLDLPLHTYGMPLALPSPTGELVECRVALSPIMEPELEAKFPDMQTYLVEAADRSATGRMELTPRGLTAMLRSNSGATGTWMIDLWQSADPHHIVVYDMNNLPGGNDWTCHTTPGVHGQGGVEVPGYTSRAVQTRRTLRVAMACTGEFALHECDVQHHAPNTADPMAAILTIIARTNVVYEQDLAVHMNLVANNDLLIFINPDTDPYPTSCDGTGGADCSGSYLSINISTLSSLIGNANFDIGHLLTRIYGGVAYLSSICTGNKAGGISGIPRGGDIDPFTANVVIHEMGHQFGANHTFNGTRGRCAGNVNLPTAWEAGSGSSPMAYAGGCPVGDAPPTDNVVQFADPFFHHGSWGEMQLVLTNASCPVQTASSNNIPVIVSSTPSTAIPPGTPFVLTASARDQDNDPLTYSWEEYDSGFARPLSGTGAVDNGQGALFRVFPPVPSPSRTFPRMADVLSGTPTPGEMLPTTTGVTRRFRVIVRDNVPGAGGVAVSDFTNLSIAAGASPFAVLAPAPGELVHPGTYTARWSVGNTNVAPISCTSVTIRLSADNGITFPTSLGTFPNTGSASITIPAGSGTARIRIDANNQIFFAVSRPFAIFPDCVADFDDGSGTGTPDGGVTIDDLVYFLFLFESGDLHADVDDGTRTGTHDAGVTIDDLLYFLQRFEVGC